LSREKMGNVDATPLLDSHPVSPQVENPDMTLHHNINETAPVAVAFQESKSVETISAPASSATHIMKRLELKKKNYSPIIDYVDPPLVKNTAENSRNIIAFKSGPFFNLPSLDTIGEEDENKQPDDRYIPPPVRCNA
jgi:hypothetical protein